MESINYFTYENKDYFKNKHILITGATGGIGKVLVNTLYNLDANMCLISRNEDKLKKTFISILNENPNKNTIKYEILDLENPNKITYQFLSIMKKLKGRLDILIMCRGKYNQSLITNCEIKTFDEMININVRSTMHILSLSVPFLKMSKGNCVIISSMESIIPVNYGFLNSMTKSMINSLIQCSALELASFGVRINGVAPGVTNTKHRVNDIFTEENNKKYMKEYSNMFLLNKNVLKPEDIVNNILFLASDDADFITGEIIENDNGYSLNHDFSYSSDNL